MTLKIQHPVCALRGDNDRLFHLINSKITTYQSGRLITTNVYFIYGNLKEKQLQLLTIYACENKMISDVSNMIYNVIYLILYRIMAVQAFINKQVAFYQSTAN